jgi:hypothetical protein
LARAGAWSARFSRPAGLTGSGSGRLPLLPFGRGRYGHGAR